MMEDKGTKKTIFWAVFDSNDGPFSKKDLVEYTENKEVFYKWLDALESSIEKEHGRAVLINCGMI